MGEDMKNQLEAINTLEITEPSSEALPNPDIEKMHNGYVPASEVPFFENFEWKAGKVPRVRLRDDGFLEDTEGNLVVVRSAFTGDLPLEETQVTDLFNSAEDASAFSRWKKSTLGEGLYTGNTPNAYPSGRKNPNRHAFVLSVDIGESDIFDCTTIDLEEDPPAEYTRKLAILALESRVFLQPPESVFRQIYRDARAVKLFAELPYHLFHGGALHSKMCEEKRIPPRWLLIRDVEGTEIKILGKS